MVRTVEQNSISFNEQVYVDEIIVMNLIANIEINDPEKMSYSPIISNLNEYGKNRDEFDKIRKEFEDKIFAKQEELINELNI